jgi:hypothetical protein
MSVAEIDLRTVHDSKRLRFSIQILKTHKRIDVPVGAMSDEDVPFFRRQRVFNDL